MFVFQTSISVGTVRRMDLQITVAVGTALLPLSRASGQPKSVAMPQHTTSALWEKLGKGHQFTAKQTSVLLYRRRRPQK